MLWLQGLPYKFIVFALFTADLLLVWDNYARLFVFFLSVCVCVQELMDGLVVNYAMLDIDSWISSILPSVLHEEWCKYHCLCDYNVEIIEVSWNLIVCN